MPHHFKVEELEFQKRGAPIEVFDLLSSPRLGQLAGCKWLQVDIRRLEPGKFSFPYHAHRASEEFFMILSGQATLRSPEGFRTVTAQEIVIFPAGAEHAHQLYNHGDEDCVYLDVRTTPAFDVVDYPDTGKVNILPQMEVYDQKQGRCEYYSGEQDVARHWPADVLKPEK